jgi:hypothetical protein
MNHDESQYPNITKLDVHLAKLYAPILLKLGNEKKTTTYAGLIATARGVYPTDQHISNAIPVSTGRRLDIIRIIALKNDMPDLTALVVSSATDRPGALGPQDPAVLSQVLSFDWQGRQLCFDDIEKNVYGLSQKNTLKKPKIKREDALHMMSEFNKAHKESLPKD